MAIAIVGAQGYVGKHMCTLFQECTVVRYDIDLGSKDEVNKCDVAFVCVPTNMKEDGSCDTSIVEEVVSWIECDLIILRSTVPPGTVDRLVQETGKHIVMNPEYVGETTDHPLNDTSKRGFVILGGEKEATEKAFQVYQKVYNASVRFMRCSAKESEVIKYTENSFIGTYVTFCNDMARVARTFGVEWSVVREGFLMDPRMTPFWTFVYPDKPGFDGKCIPKDMNAIVQASTEAGYDPEFLRAVLENNERIKSFRDH